MDFGRIFGWLMALLLIASNAYGQSNADRDSSNVQTLDGKQLQEVSVSAPGHRLAKTWGLGNTDQKTFPTIAAQQLPIR